MCIRDSPSKICTLCIHPGPTLRCQPGSCLSVTVTLPKPTSESGSPARSTPSSVSDHNKEAVSPGNAATELLAFLLTPPNLNMAISMLLFVKLLCQNLPLDFLMIGAAGRVCSLPLSPIKFKMYPRVRPYSPLLRELRRISTLDFSVNILPTCRTRCLLMSRCMPSH